MQRPAQHRPEQSRLTARTVRLGGLVLAAWIATANSGLAVEASGNLQRGEALFQQQCAKCHGSQGQGVEEFYPDPLAGDYPREHLREIIETTMPEDDPGACVGEDAAAVTAYVYEMFYSPTRQRAAPPERVELARLTVAQYRNTITDLLLSMRSSEPLVVQGGGLEATYYSSRRLESEDAVLQRTDASIDFDFAQGPPEPSDEFKPEEFAIRWEGGLKVDRTGLYRLHLYSENGANVWLNNNQSPLIDAWVRSGDSTHEQAEVLLLGGRIYPLKVEFFKSNDERASISLRWEPPGGVEEVIPNYHLVRGDFPELFVVSATFPPDDRSLGYERGTSAARSWAEATTAGAIETANAVLADLTSYAALSPEDEPHSRFQKLRAFCLRFVEAAFRRPLSEGQQATFIDRYLTNAEDLDSAVKQVVLLALKSPRFLYPNLAVEIHDDFATASRLAYALWDCPPDRQLLAAAEQGQLQTRRQIIAQARRMMLDHRARAKLHNFFRYWLDLDADHDLSKDAQRFAGFDARLIVDLERSLERFVEQVAWSDKSDFRELLLEDALLLNPRLAAFYGGAPDGDDFTATELEEMPRGGVLTHPYMLAALAHPAATSPIHRGVFVLRKLLGRALRSPPEAIELLDETTHPQMTTRQRVALQTSADSCQKCHAMINPLGFALEHYDAVGRFRETENSRPIESSGEYLSLDGQNWKFGTSRELAELLAGSSEAHRAFVEEVFVFTARQPLWAYGPEAGEQLYDHFQRSQYHIRELVISAATLAALGPAAHRERAPEPSIH